MNLKNIFFRTKEFAKELMDEDPLMIVPYLSYANDTDIVIRGRVIEDEGVLVQEDDNFLENLIANIKRFESDEAKDTEVVFELNEMTYKTVTDSEGYFDFKIKAELPQVSNGDIKWTSARAFLPDYVNESGSQIESEVRIMRSHEKSEYAIITDIDDTILKSHVNSFLKLKLIYDTFFKNHHTRSSFPDINKVLTHISQNSDGERVNPLFYLSHSPWNLYELLHQFLHVNNIPDGPFFLRDFGLKFGAEKHAYENHKILTIQHLCHFYSELNFILIGDATEHDVDIYKKAYEEFPDRIQHIFIRASTKDKKNQRILEIAKDNPNMPLHLIHKSEEISEIIHGEGKHKH